ncbi:zinc ribbon domain-containing protein [Variovorax saccharolyticus]|uniref:zinc ribbon domain-containing protein n=1 Tax=Variovorax saccharolyticus TaxID=3053516 RepID=UPI0025782060|nr:zinc ribbon domain-containing protein [Variovorax sp. J31P216]MDM0028403.1 zinc ribbon domain-containing protein [Variovorax sp. J31P216]
MMTIFCTHCGTPAAQDILFCENCGGAMRKPALASQATGAQAANQPSGLASSARPAASATKAAASPLSKGVFYGAIALGVLAIGGGGAAYLALKTPDPTAARLLAAVKPADVKSLADRSKAELCLSNLNYSGDRFNVEQFDKSTQDWMNTLVAAGLFSPGVPVESRSGFFMQTSVQYRATPELDKWREGTRLCLAKSVALADVVDIGEPTNEQVPAGASKSPTVRARLTLQSIETASWLADATVRSALTASLNDWEYQDGKLQKKVDARFVFRDGAWASSGRVQARVEPDVFRKSSGPGMDKAAASKPGWFASFANLFTFGGEPSEGDMTAAFESSMAQSNEAMSGLTGSKKAFKVYSVKKIGCKSDGEKAYRCDVESDIEAPMIGRNKGVANLRFVKASDGWTVTK